MFPAHIPRKAYQVTSDDEFRQIKLSLEEKLAQGSRPTEQPIFTDPEEAGRVLMLEHAMSSQEWSVLMNLTCTLLEGFEEKGVIAVEARKALALAKHSRVAEATQTAKSAYNNHPEYFESYAAMAAACLACAQPLEAAKWFPLVIAARGGDAPWFKTMVKEQKFLLSLAEKANTVILPLLLTSEGLEVVKPAAEDPSDFEDASFLAAIEAIRADHSCLQQQKEANPILLSLFNRIALTDTTRWTLPKSELNQESAGLFAKLSNDIIEKIHDQFNGTEYTTLKATCKPLNSALSSPALWRNAWMKFVALDGSASRTGHIEENDWPKHAHSMIMCFRVFQKALALMQEMPLEDGNKEFLHEHLMDDLRDFVAYQNPVGHVFYNEPLRGALYAIMDLSSEWPHPGFVYGMASLFFPLLPRLLIGTPNCPLQRVLALDVMTRITSMSEQASIVAINDGYLGLASQLLSVFPNPAAAVLCALRTHSATPFEMHRLCLPSYPIALFQRPNPIDFSGLFHLRATYNNYSHRNRADFGLCRLNFSDATVNEIGVACYKLSGFGHDSIRGEFQIKTFGDGCVLNLLESDLTFLVEYANGFAFKFTGALSSVGLSGTFDVFNPLMPEADDAENMDSDNPNSLVSQGIKGSNSYPTVGSWLMLPEHDTDISKLKAHGLKTGMKVDSFETDKFQLWKNRFLVGIRDDEDEETRDVDPWRMEREGERDRMQRFCLNWATRTTIFYSGQSDILAIANMVTSSELRLLDENELAAVAAMPVFTPPFGRIAEDSDEKHERRATMYYTAVTYAYQVRIALINMLPSHTLKAHIDILLNAEHPDLHKTLRFWLEFLSLTPWDNSTFRARLAEDIVAAMQLAEESQGEAYQPDMSSFIAAGNVSSKKKQRGVSTTMFLTMALIGTAVIGFGAFAIGRWFGRKKSN